MKILISCVLFFVSAFCYAQLKVGATAGLQITNLNVRYDLALEPTTAQLNPMLGAFLEYGINKNISITGEIIYAPFSYKSDKMEAVASNGNSLGYISRHTINYLSLPLAFNYNVDVKTSKFKIGFGPAFNIKLSDKLSLKQANTTSTNNTVISGTKGVASLNTAIYLHTGVEFSKFLILLHTQKILTGVFESSRAAYEFNGYSFGIKVGYFFKK